MTQKLGASDTFLLELFASDAGSHAAALDRGLSAISRAEADPQKLLPELMLSAHSVKGAARIVQLDEVASIADALENCFRAVEEGGLSLSPEVCRALLPGAQALGRAAQEPVATLLRWGAHNAAYVETVIAALKALLKGGPPATPSKPAEAPSAVRLSVIPAVDPTIFELFRTEAEGCMATLSRGLVELESGQQGSFDELMRAAHSFKGAARVVGISVATRVAHAMEECFVAAQQGRLKLAPPHVDALLRGVDLLAEVARCPLARLGAWQADRGPAAEQLSRTLHAIAAGDPSATSARSVHVAPSPTALAVTSEPANPVAQRAGRMETAGETVDRVIRVGAASINRLMGLAGESLVESRRVQSLSASMQRLKRRHTDLGTTLEKLERHGAAEQGPELCALIAEAKVKAAECRSLVALQMTELDAYAQRVDDLSDRLYREALKSRMRPFRDGVHGLPRMVRDIARQLDRQVKLELHGESTEVDRDVLESLEAPLNHLLRNAIDHGIEPGQERLEAGKPAMGTVRVEARHRAGMLAITVSDDGRGIDLDALRHKVVERKLLTETVAAGLSERELTDFIFLPGFSTARGVTEISGRGVGLDAVKNAVEAASGNVTVSSVLGAGTIFHLSLPVTRSVLRAVVADVAGEPYAFPLLGIERVLRVPASSVRSVANLQYVVIDEQNVALVSARQALGLGAENVANDELCIVVIADRSSRYALTVDKFLGEHDLVVRPLDARLGKVQDVAAAAILMDGSPALILDVEDLVRSIEKLAHAGRIDQLSTAGAALPARTKKRILVVDDSITVREAERQLLANRGYEVDVAVDGIDGWNSVRKTRYDLVISDIDMPRMNGIELVKTIKQDATLNAIPVVIVSYKDRKEDRMRGLDAGANYYLTKSSFHDQTLVQAVEDLIGAVDR